VFAVGKQCLDLLRLQMFHGTLLVGMEHRGLGAEQRRVICVFSIELGCLDNILVLSGVIGCVHIRRNSKFAEKKQQGMVVGYKPRNRMFCSFRYIICFSSEKLCEN